MIAEELTRIDDERLDLVTITAIDVDAEMNRAIVFFGVFVSATMLLVLWRHLYNQSKGDSLHLIAEEGDGRHH